MGVLYVCPQVSAAAATWSYTLAGLQDAEYFQLSEVKSDTELWI